MARDGKCSGKYKLHYRLPPKYRYWILCLYSGSVAFCLDLNITRHKVDASDYHNKFTRPDKRHGEFPYLKRHTVLVNSITFCLAEPEGLSVGVS